MKYETILNGLIMLLNKKGRSKKGVKKQDEFKGYVKILKDDFKKEISTQFLFNLMKDNKSLTNIQKRRKIQNLIIGLKRYKQSLYLRGLEVMTYRTDIIEYKTDKKGLIYSEKCELSDKEKEQLKQIDEVKNKSGVCLFKVAEEDLNNRQKNRDFHNKEGQVFIKNIRNEQIAKEFVCSKQKKFNFIKA